MASLMRNHASLLRPVKRGVNASPLEQEIRRLRAG